MRMQPLSNCCEACSFPLAIFRAGSVPVGGDLFGTEYEALLRPEEPLAPTGCMHITYWLHAHYLLVACARLTGCMHTTCWLHAQAEEESQYWLHAHYLLVACA